MHRYAIILLDVAPPAGFVIGFVVLVIAAIFGLLLLVRRFINGKRKKD